MNKIVFFFLNCLLIGSVLSCKVSESPSADKDKTTVDSTLLEVSPSIENESEVVNYRAERTRHFKLQHTKLEVSFDWQKQWVHGKALLFLEPYFYEHSTIILDAKGFDVHEVSLIRGEKSQQLDYEYDGEKLSIDLGKSFRRREKFNLQVNYTAKPNEPDSLDPAKKGLYFINPLGKEKGKPQQIWTHGETEDNSRWVPTLDAPNQKTTQEIFITVDDQFKTLSNGTLVYSRSNSDSTRTDYWKMDQPHAPYLMMLAVGDFSVVEDSWNDKIVSYFVEPAYEKYARDIFGNTPEMLDYFSKILKYPFPWDKYSQVVVRDFVSGAMENTTASVFMQDLQIDSRELLDYDWDDIIAHELFHQWFGDLVTCESWANLPLNESFATYGEFLWKDFKYGNDEGAYHLLDELTTYLEEAKTKNEDLIRYYYTSDDDMFDSHSYAKGGLILHLLRDYVGDEAFFHSLNHYLTKHEFGKAEVHELRMAFEYVTGEDLNWFFNQWFLASGHPKLRIEDSIEDNIYKLKIWQEQGLDQYPVYKLHLTMDLWENGRKSQYLLEVDKPYQEFEFYDIQNPELVLVDSDHVLVGEIVHEKSPETYQLQLTRYNDNVRARIDALNHFLENPYDSISSIVLLAALDDSFWAVREEALIAIEKDTLDLFEKSEQKIAQLAKTDPNSLVRAAAISVLSVKERSKYIDIFMTGINDSSYSVAGQSLYAFLQSGEENVGPVIEKFKDETNFNITSSLADYFIMNQDHTYFDWFTEKILRYSGSELWYFTKLYGMYLITAPDDLVKRGTEELREIAINHPQYYNRLSAYQSLELLIDYEGVSEKLSEIKEKENDPRLIEYYQK